LEGFLISTTADFLEIRRIFHLQLVGAYLIPSPVAFIGSFWRQLILKVPDIGKINTKNPISSSPVDMVNIPYI